MSFFGHALHYSLSNTCIYSHYNYTVSQDLYQLNVPPDVHTRYYVFLSFPFSFSFSQCLVYKVFTIMIQCKYFGDDLTEFSTQSHGKEISNKMITLIIMDFLSRTKMTDIFFISSNLTTEHLEED